MILATAAGNLGRDAELKISQGGTSICKFSIACKHGYGDKGTTQWIQCVLFGKRADGLHSHLTKGLAVTVTGEAKAVYWSKDGEANGAIEIIADKVVLQGKSERGNSGGMYGDSGGGETAPDSNDLADDIPFAHPYELKMKKDVL